MSDPRHIVFTFDGGITVTFGDSVSRKWAQLMAPMIAEEEGKKRGKESRKK